MEGIVEGMWGGCATDQAAIHMQVRRSAFKGCTRGELLDLDDHLLGV